MMNTQEHELLSSLLDGELSERESERAVELLLRDPEAQEMWAIWHTLRDRLRGEAGLDISSGRLKKVLYSEAPPAAPAPLRPAANAFRYAGIAAALAVVAFTAGMWWQGHVLTAPNAATMVRQQNEVPSSPDLEVNDVLLVAGSPAGEDVFIDDTYYHEYQQARLRQENILVSYAR